MKRLFLLILLLIPVLSQSAPCGRVSKFLTPPSGRDLYPADFVTIDGNHKVHTRSEFRLAPGKHVIELVEYITDPMLTLKPHQRQKRKTLTLEVEPDLNYYIGAEFIRKNRQDFRNQSYWQPVVWKVKEKSCQMKKPDVKPVRN